MPQTAIISSIRNAHARPVLACAIAMAVLLSMQTARAGDARQGVKARPGEIVLLRTVSTRPATRPQPPGVALLVDPSPNRELKAVLGNSSELGDAQIAALTASPVQGVTHRFGRVITQVLGAPSTGSVRRISPDNTAPGMAPMGAIGQTTRGLGNTVQQAMRAIPVPSGPH